MTIKKQGGVRRTTVGELLTEDLRIPPYQRLYCWEPAMALQLLDDIRSAKDDSKRRDVPYVLGAVIIHKEDNILNVVDGQQRLLTLHMILSLLETTSDCESSVSSNNSIGRVRASLNRSIKALSENESGNQVKQTLAKFIREKCELIRVETDDIDEAFRVFDSQNYRGKPLAPHDLLKAYHLREMRETLAIKAAAVEAWESVRDDDLDRLFSIYLYRIARWSRGESAPGFTIHDIGMFKGISPKKSRSPNALYHTAAQAAIPLLNMWGSSFSGNENRDVGRMRFQLDAPLLAGLPFFEMVAFMLTELRQLALEAFTEESKGFALYNLDNIERTNDLKERPNQSRYRYVSELYLAALLYYTNKFGDEDIKVARDQFFAWAYSLRVNLLRVQFRSIDNLARGNQLIASAFTLIRNAESASALSQQSMPINLKPYNDTHEIGLVNYLKKSGF
jgi:hypothetical protein